MASYKDALNRTVEGWDKRGSPGLEVHMEPVREVSNQHIRGQVPHGRTLVSNSPLACPLLCYRIGDAGKFNPYYAVEGEKLPVGFGRNYFGLLMRHLNQGPSLDLMVLELEAAKLKETTVIASFIGKKVPQSSFVDWIQSINQKLGYNGVSLKMDMGRGFIFLKTANISTTRKLLAMTPQHTAWGQCVHQEWVPNFNPDYP
ncbi:hypothetical protein M758_UG293800 [Ceratodon purpureus]|nr:hypothetical protein M758_UG293800 [Ceratodon purpureus]